MCRRFIVLNMIAHILLIHTFIFLPDQTLPAHLGLLFTFALCVKWCHINSLFSFPCFLGTFCSSDRKGSGTDEQFDLWLFYSGFILVNSGDSMEHFLNFNLKDKH